MIVTGKDFPGKAGEIEENFWHIWTGVGMVVCGLGWGYVFCAADYNLDTDAAAKKYGGPIGDDAFAEAAYAADRTDRSRIWCRVLFDRCSTR